MKYLVIENNTKTVEQLKKFVNKAELSNEQIKDLVGVIETLESFEDEVTLALLEETYELVMKAIEFKEESEPKAVVTDLKQLKKEMQKEMKKLREENQLNNDSIRISMTEKQMEKGIFSISTYRCFEDLALEFGSKYGTFIERKKGYLFSDGVDINGSYYFKLNN